MQGASIRASALQQSLHLIQEQSLSDLRRWIWPQRSVQACWPVLHWASSCLRALKASAERKPKVGLALLLHRCLEPL